MQCRIRIPGLGELEGDAPVVVLGPNGSGKTKLAQNIAASNKVTAISAQRRTWLDDNLPVQEERQLWSHVQGQQSQWQSRSWHPTEEINHVMSTLVQEHTNALTKRNEEARAANVALPPLNDGRLIRLQDLWSRLFPQRKLEIGGFFPKVRRLDGEGNAEVTYSPREMSDGERTILYMAARVLTAEHPLILVDEPELHMHSRLAVLFWSEAEKLRSECRFVYITHDLHFALSRRRATVLLARSGTDAIQLSVDDLPASIAPEVLGAATLPFYAKRVCLFEGEPGKGFASEFMSAWFDGDETFTIACGDRGAVCAAASGLLRVGVSGATVVGLVDRDFYSEEALASVPAGVIVLPVHEIESVLCDRNVVEALAGHLGKAPDVAWTNFLTSVQRAYTGQTLSSVVARRVRARVNDLLNGAFSGSQIASTLADTRDRHTSDLQALDLPSKVQAMFAEEESRVGIALSSGGHELLAVLPGKHLLSILSGELGFDGQADLTGLVVAALNASRSDMNDGLGQLGRRLDVALTALLPERRVQ